MEGFEIIETEQWFLAPLIGSQHPFFTINANTVIYTWLMLLIITILFIPIRWIIRKKDSVGRFLILSFIEFFVDLYNQAATPFSFTHFSFITAIFCFIFLCNTISIIPWMGEPTIDLNTTLALGIISFIYTQGAAVYAQGLWPYIKGYFSPFFIMLPLNVVGKLASVVSISFRLFGNIFGGSIITKIYFTTIKGSIIFETLGMITGINMLLLLFFTLFEGFLQAFVFAMLSLTYLSMAIQGEGH